MDGSRVFADGALEGTVALVTGGGTNLGKAAAAELAACGAEVMIAGRREDVLEATSQQIGERCSWAAGDIRQREQAGQIVREVLERHGRLDFLLNNAGGQYFVPAEGITTKGWGKSKPIVPNTRRDGSDDPEGRKKNRRVEITVRTS